MRLKSSYSFKQQSRRKRRASLEFTSAYVDRNSTTINRLRHHPTHHHNHHISQSIRKTDSNYSHIFDNHQQSMMIPPSKVVQQENPQERMGSYLHPRDLRRLVTPFSSTNETELIVRRHVLLFNYDPIRAILLRDRLLVIVPQDDTNRSMLLLLEKRVREGWSTDDDKTINGFFGSISNLPSLLETKNSKNNINQNQQQRQQAGLLLSMDGSIKGNTSFNRKVGLSTAGLVGGISLSDYPLSLIRIVQDATWNVSSRVYGFVQSIDRILDDDQLLALMNLSRLLTHPERFIVPVPNEVLDKESDEPELLLEGNLQVGLNLLNSLELVQGKIDTASQMITQHQDALRNRLLYANMLVAVLSVCISCGSMLGSFFGMNVPNHLEDNDSAFIVITTSIMTSIIVMGVTLYLCLLWSGTIPRTAFTSNGR